MNIGTLSANELCIMQLLWKEGRALSRPEILEGIPDKKWNPNSIHLILNNMIQKGVLDVEGLARCGRGYGRTYIPKVTQAQYAAAQTIEATPNMNQRQRLTGVFASLVDIKGIDKETIEEIEAMIAEKKRELDIK